MTTEDLNKLKLDKSAFSPAVKGRSKRKLWIAVAVAAAVAVVAAMRLFSSAVAVETTAVTQIYPSQSFTLLNASGYVVAQRKAAVAAKITGRLEWLGVKEGSKVKASQILARLEGKDAAATRDQAAAALKTAQTAVVQAQAELTDAEADYKRQKELVNQGIVSRSDFDAAEARFHRDRAALEGSVSSVKGAMAALRGAETGMEYTLIRAPFDAVVLTKNADIGDIITPLGAAANAKAAVVTIADMGSLQVEADVSESNLGKIREGQPCEIQLDALPDKRFRGQLQTIVPTADRSKASVMVKVRFVDQDQRVLPEMSARVAFLERDVHTGEEKPLVAVNPAAVAERGGKKVVFRLKGDTVEEVPVTVGNKIGDFVEVSGVKPGDKLALKPLDKLKNGSRVKTAEK